MSSKDSQASFDIVEEHDLHKAMQQVGCAEQPSSISSHIQCGTFDALCEHTLNGQGKPPKILLIDEVDVFFDADAFCTVYNPGEVKHPAIIGLADDIWPIRKHPALSVVQTSPAYAECFGAIKDMMVDLKDVDSATHHDRKSQDGISDKIVIHYETLFACYAEKEKGTISEANWRDHMKLMLGCDSYSYSPITKYFDRMIGVTGSLQNINLNQMKIIEKDFNFKRHTYLPLAYGPSQREFFPNTDTVVSAREFYYFLKVAAQISSEIASHKRPVVVCLDENDLMEFWDSKAFQEVRPMAQKMTKEATKSEKRCIIITRAFGRGTDFVNPVVKVAGGVHVLQEFLNEDKMEEVQIYGRTARQGQKGFYSMIMLQEDLEKTHENLEWSHFLSSNLNVWIKVAANLVIGNALLYISCATIIAIITSYVPWADLLSRLCRLDKSKQDSNLKAASTSAQDSSLKVTVSNLNQVSFDNGTCKTLVDSHKVAQQGDCAEQPSLVVGLLPTTTSSSSSSSSAPTAKNPVLSIFSLSSTLDKWQLVKDRLGKGQDQEEENRIRGMQAALSALRDIYQFSCPDWEAVRDKVHVGFFNSSSRDDSVSSMGLAEKLNCGVPLQADEGEIDLNAIRSSMHRDPSDFSPVGLLSIGQQKSKFIVGDCEVETNRLDDLPGMENGVLALGPRLVKHLIKLGLTVAVQSVLARNQIPVIILAGGTLSLLKGDPSLCAQLIEPTVPPSEPLRPVSLHLAPFNQRRLEILECVRQLDKLSNFNWNKPFLIPRLTFSSSSSPPPLSLTVHLPITFARLCAAAAVCLNKPTANYLRMFSAQELTTTTTTNEDSNGSSSGGGCGVRLTELKKDSDVRKLKGDEVLYFFTEEEELLDKDEATEAQVKKGLFAPPVFNSNRLWDTIKEYLIRAQHLFPHDPTVVQQAVINKYGLTAERVQEMISSLAKTPEEVTRIFKPYENSLILTSLSNSSPPIPSQFILPSLHSLHQNNFQKLPLGMYKGNAGSFYDVVSQELNVINKNFSSNVTAEGVRSVIELELEQCAVDCTDTVNYFQTTCEIVARIYCHITVHVVEPHPCRIKSFGSGSAHMWLFYNCNTWFPLWSPPPSSLSSSPLLTLLAPFFIMIQPPSNHLSLSMKMFAQEWGRIRVDREIFEEVKYTMSEIAHATFLEALEGCACDICKLLCIRWTQRLEEVLDFGKAQNYKETVCLIFGPQFVAHLKLLNLTDHEKVYYECVLRDFFALLRTNMTKENYAITFLADEALFLSSFEDTSPLVLNSLITSFVVPIPAPANLLNEEILLTSLTFELPLGLHSGKLQQSLIGCVAQQLQALGITPASCTNSHDANSVHGDIVYFWANNSLNNESGVHMSECEVVYSWREAVVAIAHMYGVNVYVAQHCAGTNKPVFSFGGSNIVSRDAIWLFKNKLNEWSSLWSTPVQQHSKQQRHLSEDQH